MQGDRPSEDTVRSEQGELSLVVVGAVFLEIIQQTVLAAQVTQHVLVRCAW